MCYFELDLPKLQYLTSVRSSFYYPRSVTLKGFFYLILLILDIATSVDSSDFYVELPDSFQEVESSSLTSISSLCSFVIYRHPRCSPRYRRWIFKYWQIMKYIGFTFARIGMIVFVIHTLLIPVFRILDTIQISDISQ